MENIIHLDKKTSVTFNVKVDQMLLDDIIKIVHFINAYNHSRDVKINCGHELYMFYKSQLDPRHNNPVSVDSK